MRFDGIHIIPSFLNTFFNIVVISLQYVKLLGYLRNVCGQVPSDPHPEFFPMNLFRQSLSTGELLLCPSPSALIPEMVNSRLLQIYWADDPPGNKQAYCSQNTGAWARATMNLTATACLTLSPSLKKKGQLLKNRWWDSISWKGGKTHLQGKEENRMLSCQTSRMVFLSIWDFSECMDVLFRPVIFSTASLNRSAPSLQSTNTNTGGLKSFLSWKLKTYI